MQHRMDGGRRQHCRCNILWVLFCLLLTGCSVTTLFNNLEEQEVNEMIAILKQYGIPATKTIGKESCALSVPSNHFSMAIDLLNAQGYPLPKYQTLGDVFKKSGLVSSPLEERVRFMNALSESVALTLSKVPGVLKSRVHIVLPENDPYAEKTIPSSAAVFLAYRSDSMVEDYVRDIKYLVTNSIEGLEYDKVTVALFPLPLPPLPKALGKSDTMFSIAGIEMTDGSKMQFFMVLGVLIATIVALLMIMLWMLISARRTKKEKKKEIKIENLAEASDMPPDNGAERAESLDSNRAEAKNS
ncbi:MAG: type III secretion inner membrane ring lipoprotein SctJ [Puniceicoccales bacterium]|jgi:type III secretion protein J|nr:type III secretion inner membrane ring lipoprotein SctJ [Puniceicoccales bacterium]